MSCSVRRRWRSDFVTMDETGLSGINEESALGNLPAAYQPELIDYESIDAGAEVLMPEPEQRGRFTGEQVARNRGRYLQAVKLLSEGFGIRATARAMSMSSNTVAAIRDREASLIETAKQGLSRLCMRGAQLSVEGYLEDLAAGKVSPKDKLIGAGILTDKGLALAGEASVIIEHRGNADFARELAREAAALTAIPVASSVSSDCDSGVSEDTFVDSEEVTQ